jgi:D-alanyl-D-alanine dipeptidase
MNHVRGSNRVVAIALIALCGLPAAIADQAPAQPEIPQPPPLARARELRGHYANAGKTLELDEQSGKLVLFQFDGFHKVELKMIGDRLISDDPLIRGPEITVNGNQITLKNETYTKVTATRPPEIPSRWRGLIGEYGPDNEVLYVLERGEKLCVLIQSRFEYPLIEEGPDHFRFPAYGRFANEPIVFSRDPSGRATNLEFARVKQDRRQIDGETDATFHVKPVRPVADVRAEFQAAKPPVEPGSFRAPDLVELIKQDPTIHLDIRYATANNFLGVPLYTTARAFLQRPAADALLRVQQSLKPHGFQLLVHDAYRPWSVTKLFWEAVPPSGKGFVADPAKGSKHNRGAAVDLTLWSLADGAPARMVGGYDEFSPRSHPYYPGGTSRQRWQRNLLRSAMEAQGFSVNRVEWWHFDYRGWEQYPILDVDFDKAGSARANQSRTSDFPTSHSGQSLLTASLAASVSRANPTISDASATGPSSGSRATRSNSFSPSSSSGKLQRSASSANSFRNPGRLAHFSRPSVSAKLAVRTFAGKYTPRRSSPSASRLGIHALPSSSAARRWSSDHPSSPSSPQCNFDEPSQSPSAPKALSSTPATSSASRSSNVPRTPPTVSETAIAMILVWGETRGFVTRTALPLGRLIGRQREPRSNETAGEPSSQAIVSLANRPGLAVDLARSACARATGRHSKTDANAPLLNQHTEAYPEAAQSPEVVS